MYSLVKRVEVLERFDVLPKEFRDLVSDGTEAVTFDRYEIVSGRVEGAEYVGDSDAIEALYNVYATDSELRRGYIENVLLLSTLLRSSVTVILEELGRFDWEVWNRLLCIVGERLNVLLQEALGDEFTGRGYGLDIRESDELSESFVVFSARTVKGSVASVMYDNSESLYVGSVLTDVADVRELLSSGNGILLYAGSSELSMKLLEVLRLMSGYAMRIDVMESLRSDYELKKEMLFEGLKKSIESMKNKG